MFKNNVGPKDRVYRAAAAIILVSSYFSTNNWSWSWVALFIGLYLLFSAMMSSCAIYSVTGRDTNRENKAEAEDEAQANA